MRNRQLHNDRPGAAARYAISKRSNVDSRRRSKRSPGEFIPLGRRVEEGVRGRPRRVHRFQCRTHQAGRACTQNSQPGVWATMASLNFAVLGDLTEW
jgi:hypothetical protein